jgi:hypothetical protein
MGEWMQTYISTLDAVGDAVASKCGERDLEGSDGTRRGRPVWSMEKLGGPSVVTVEAGRRDAGTSCRGLV